MYAATSIRNESHPAALFILNRKTVTRYNSELFHGAFAHLDHNYVALSTSADLFSVLTLVTSFHDM